MIQNLGNQNVTFQMVATTGTTVGYYTLNGGNRTLCANAAVNHGLGVWTITLLAPETNGSDVSITLLNNGSEAVTKTFNTRADTLTYYTQIPKVSCPEQFYIPTSGQNVYKIKIQLLNGQGNPGTFTSPILLHVTDPQDDNLDSILDGTTFAYDALEENYVATVTINSTFPPRQALFKLQYPPYPFVADTYYAAYFQAMILPTPAASNLQQAGN